jgi:hypothetical protein
LDSHLQKWANIAGMLYIHRYIYLIHCYCMETKLNKSVINGLLAILAPGAFLLLCITWMVSLAYKGQPNYFNSNELLFLFLFLLAAYILGLINDALCQWAEGRLLVTLYKKRPQLRVIDQNKHWLAELDAFYKQSTGLSLYETNRETDQPMPGDYNGHKLHKYNLSQFERFAVFVLAKEGLDEKIDSLKSKYILLRNLIPSFVCSSAGGVVLYLMGMLHTGTRIIFYHPYFVLALAVSLLLACIWLCRAFTRGRLEYLTELYRYTRFYYLLHNKN